MGSRLTEGSFALAGEKALGVSGFCFFKSTDGI
jgi:hypothetical protein